METINILDESTFVKLVESSPIPVLAVFKAPWCGLCKVLGPIVEAVAKENPEKFQLVLVDVEEVPALAQSEGIRKVPTMVLYKNGKEDKRVDGLLPKARVVSFVE